MDTYQTEEEQVEALKKWWQENSKSTIAAIVLALAAGYGWQGWQTHKQEQAEQASVMYQDLLDAVSALESDSSTPAQRTTAEHLANNLKAEFSGTVYAQFAALHLARLAVQGEELAAAEEQLRWVLTAAPAEEIQLVAQLRLARVLGAQGDTAAALKILEVEDAGAYAAAYAEAQGDMHMQLEQADQARSAYERALAAALAAGSAASRSLELKLQSLTPVPARELNNAIPEA